MFDNISLANVDRFPKFFHQLICKEILYIFMAKISTLSAVCHEIWKSKNIL